MKKPETFDTDFFVPLSGELYVEKCRRGVELAVGGERFRLEAVRPDVLKISISKGGSFDEPPTGAVLTDDFGINLFSLDETAEHISLSTDCLRAEIDRETFALTIARPDGSVVLETEPGRSFLALNERWAMSCRSGAGDTFLGFGQKTGALDKAGRRMSMWNSDIILEGGEPGAFADDYDPYYISIPFFYHLPEGHSDKAAAFFFDNGYRTHFDLADEGGWKAIGDGGLMTLYIFAGPSMAEILSCYTELTGRMQAPPLWALGHHQCRWHDYNAEDIRRLASEYEQRGIPCDSFWLDIDYMDAFRVFSWDREKYPDPSALTAELKERGFKTVTIIDPGIKADEDYSVYQEGVENGHFCKTQYGTVFFGKVWPGQTVFPDFVREETQAWWADHIRRHVAGGIDGIWIDMNEPAVGNAGLESMRFDRDGADYDHDRWHNQYASLMARATVDGLHEADHDRRPFVLSRAGFAGIQRHAANWMGDNHSSWEHLAMSISMCMGMGISGQPFVGCDIGGFTGDTEPELLKRWYQSAVFAPFFRNHNAKGYIDQYPWSFDGKTEDAIREAVRLRYRYLPYLYTAFMLSAETGEPIQRPLIYDFQDDPSLCAVNDQFMCGRQILVAPVIEKGADKRTVRLPQGGWYALETSDFFDGAAEIEVAADSLVCPAYVSEGSVIPVAAPVMSTANYTTDQLELHVYLPRHDGSWTSWIHEDDGITLGDLSECSNRTEFTLFREDGVTRLDIETSDKSQTAFPWKSGGIRCFGAGDLDKVFINGSSADCSDLIC